MTTHFILRAAACLALISLPAAAGSITTTYLENDGAMGAMFNLTVGPTGITINGLDLLDNSNSPLTLDVYVKSGTYVGYETDPADWTLASSTAVGKGNGATVPTAVDVTPFTLAAGKTYGIYITFTTGGNAPEMLYTHGNHSYSNGDVSLSLGEGVQGMFGSTSIFAARTWDGTIDYAPVPEPSAWALFGLTGAVALFARQRYLRKY